MNKIRVIIFLLIVFKTVYVSAQDNCKCCTDNHKAFDFWVGDWTVYNSDGKLAGTNTVEKIQEHCVLRENWVSATGGFTGTSYNFYNAKENQWEQIWVDNQGGSLHLKGNMVDNKMIMESNEAMNEDGEKFINRITWTANEDGSVRQLWEIVTPGEETQIAFDGLYKKE